MRINTNVAKTKIYQKLNCDQNVNIIKTKISPKLKYPQNRNVTKPQMSAKCKCYHNLYVTKMQMSLKHKCNKTEISSKLKRHQSANILFLFCLFLSVSDKMTEEYLLHCLPYGSGLRSPGLVFFRLIYIY